MVRHRIYTVFVDSHAQYLDVSARYQLGAFEQYETAVRAAQNIVDDYLVTAYTQGMTAEALFKLYSLFGDDPFIVPNEGEPPFSAWAYAQTRCQVLAVTGV